MKKFKFTYIEGNTINNVTTVEANSLNEAYTIFYNNFGNGVDVTKVEQVE